MHAGAGNAPDTPATQAQIADTAAALTDMADALAASGEAAEQRQPPVLSALQGQDVWTSLGGGAHTEPDGGALAMLAARRALVLIAAIMHVPAVHATLLEQQGLLQPPSTAAAIITHLSAPLLAAVRRLLAVLLSCADGLELLLRNPIAMGALLKALDPASDPYGPPFPPDEEPPRCKACSNALPSGPKGHVASQLCCSGACDSDQFYYS